MTKKELVDMLNEGPVRCKIDGVLRQLTRNPDNAAMDQDTEDFKLNKTAIKAGDSGSNIGVFDLGTAKLTTITKDSIESIIGAGSCTNE